MNHHEEEGIVDGMNGIEKESWTTTGVVEGEMRKCKACKFLISSWVDMGRPPMKIASNLNFRRHLALPTFDQDYPIKESPQLSFHSISLYIYTYRLMKIIFDLNVMFRNRYISNWKRIGRESIC